ncbi:MAG: ABC transporter permease [Rickettsiales bacterium]|nr:MAG: ABC transporter permease [Rickettsiales bacterium]
MINTLLEIAPNSLLQSLILSIIVIGIMIPFKLLNFPDLTSEGAYPLGGGACASLILYGMSPLYALVIAGLLAGIAGIGTAIINIKYKINTLLAGIIISTMLYSITLRIMSKPNVALFDQPSLFQSMAYGITTQIIILLIINFIVIITLYAFLNTEKGLQLRAVGLNPSFAEKQGINLNKNIIVGLFIGNMIIGLAGGLLIQLQHYADIGIGVGIVIHALAAMMIGEKIVGNNTILKMVISPLIGAIIYQQIQGVALTLGLAPSDLKFLTGALVLTIISIR